MVVAIEVLERPSGGCYVRAVQLQSVRLADVRNVSDQMSLQTESIQF